MVLAIAVPVSVDRIALRSFALAVAPPVLPAPVLALALLPVLAPGQALELLLVWELLQELLLPAWALGRQLAPP